MSIFFIAHTPYHIFLSCGIASLEPFNEKKYLVIVIEDIEQISIYKQIILSWEKKLFTDVYLLTDNFNVHSIKSNISRKLIMLINMQLKKLKLKSMFKKIVTLEAPKAYIFADHNVNGQYFAKICSDYNGTIIYVEDGSAVYTDHKLSKLSKLNTLITKFYHGFWYTPLEVQGTSKYIDTLMVAYPEFLRPELKRKKYVQIPEKAYSFLNDCLSPYLNDIFQINTENLDYIIILPYSLFLKDKNEIEIIKVYQLIIDNLIVNNRVGLKYHPREKTNYLNLKPSSNLSLITKSIPLEIVWMSSKKGQLKAVIGDVSTALITSKKILGSDTKIISLGKLMNINEEIYMYLAKFGIFIPNSFGELMSHLSESYS